SSGRDERHRIQRRHLTSLEALRGLHRGAATTCKEPTMSSGTNQPDEVAAPYGTGPARASSPVKRVRTHHLRQFKERGEKFSMLTAYEQYAAATFDEAGIDVLLVGDSASNNVYANETTVPVTVD